MAIVAKRTIMSLYSDSDDVYSHQVRIVLAEKGVNVEILQAKEGESLNDLLAINPYGTVPTLLDRELVLYEARITMEYLDERFPHPPLLPVYPVARAEARKMMHRIEQDWYQLHQRIKQNDEANQAREYLLESLVSLDPIFADKTYFLSDEFSLLDCALAPLLWRLPQLGIDVPETAKALHLYMQRVFKRDSFETSLTDAERHYVLPEDSMTSNKPYLIRAMYDWIVDNNLTPHILVNADYPGVQVPQEHVHGGKIVLNISPQACRGLHLENDRIVFTARFSGITSQIFVVPSAVFAIYAQENGRGMEFGDEYNEPPPPPMPPITNVDATGRKKPALKLVKKDE